MMILQVEVITNFETILRWGMLPLLLLAVVTLWRKVEKHEKAIEKLNEDQKIDIKNHAEEVKSLQQNTLNTLNEINRHYVKDST